MIVSLQKQFASAKKLLGNEFLPLPPGMVPSYLPTYLPTYLGNSANGLQILKFQQWLWSHMLA